MQEVVVGWMAAIAFRVKIALFLVSTFVNN